MESQKILKQKATDKRQSEREDNHKMEENSQPNAKMKWQI
jgi:hypothetical protein